MKYKDYRVTEFLKDQYFIRWITKPEDGPRHFWKNWLKNNPKQSANVQKARQIAKAVKYEQEYNLTDTEYTDILEGILKGQKKRSPERENLRRLPGVGARSGWAAAAVILLALGLYFLYPNNDTLDNPRSVSLVSREAPAGQKKTIKLGDGTTIKLNSGSKLRFPEKFSHEQRVVYLEGEAFFNVAEDKERPFSVISSDITTTALGTSFNVKNSQDLETVRVALVTGKVRVEDNQGSKLILNPSEILIYTDKEISKGTFDYNEEIAWIDGKLYFNEKSLEEVFEILEQWYGVRIDNKANLKGNYTGEFENNPSLEVVLNGIAFASGFDYEMNGKSITIIN